MGAQTLDKLQSDWGLGALDRPDREVEGAAVAAPVGIESAARNCTNLGHGNLVIGHAEIEQLRLVRRSQVRAAATAV